MDNHLGKGYVQVYTGNGKGKTTCMLGLTLRAVGAGKKVYIGQFMKSERYSEVYAIREFLPGVTIEQYGVESSCFIRKGEANVAHVEAAHAGYKKAMTVLVSGEYDLVILDEINVTVYFELLNEKDALAMIDSRPHGVELVLTGRYATDQVMARADLVTEMREVKHYFDQGVAARIGIEK